MLSPRRRGSEKEKRSRKRGREGRKSDRGELWLKKGKEKKLVEKKWGKKKGREGNKIQRNETRALAKETDGPR